MNVIGPVYHFLGRFIINNQMVLLFVKINMLIMSLMKFGMSDCKSADTPLVVNENLINEVDEVKLILLCIEV